MGYRPMGANENRPQKGERGEPLDGVRGAFLVIGLIGVERDFAIAIR